MFRFTIRDVLWLSVVVGLSVAWWGEYRNRGPEYRRALELFNRTTELQEQAVRDAEAAAAKAIREAKLELFLKRNRQTVSPEKN